MIDSKQVAERAVAAIDPALVSILEQIDDGNGMIVLRGRCAPNNQWFAFVIDSQPDDAACAQLVADLECFVRTAATYHQNLRSSET